MLTASLGNSEIDGERVLLTIWPSDAGEMDDGTFDVDVWEESQTHICMVRGVDPKTAWKFAYQFVRQFARKFGGFDWCPDGKDEEPCPFPDRGNPVSGLNRLHPTPKKIFIDNGVAFTSQMMMPVHLDI